MKVRQRTVAAILAISILLAVSGCQTRSPKTAEITQNRVLAEFPMTATDRNSMIILPLTIEDQQYDFLLDTGANVTVFDISFTEKLKGWYLFTPRGKDVTGTAISATKKNAPDAYIGPLSLKDNVNSVIVMDLGPLNTQSDINIDGVLGMNFLRNFVVRIDPDSKIVSFIASTPQRGLFGLFEPQTNRHPEWGTPVPIRLGWDRLPYLKGSFASAAETEFVIDTGHDGLYINLDAKTFNDVAGGDGQFQSEITTTGVTGTKLKRNASIAFLDGFTLGTLKYDSVLFREADRSIIGFVFLAHHQATFDFPNRTLYLKQVRDLTYADNIKCTLLDFGIAFEIRNGQLVAESVEPEKFAHTKGLRAGDIVVAISHKDIQGLTTAELIDVLASLEETQSIPLRVKRNDEIIDFLLE